MEIRLQVTLPKNRIDAKKYIDACAEKMKSKTAPELRRMFLETIFGWSAEDKPSFTRLLTRHARSVSMRVYVNSNAEIYTLVNDGAPAHIIRPRNAPALRFRPGYRSATIPGILRSRRAYRSGTPITTTLVHHPGFEARNFDTLIGEEYEETFKEDMQDAMNDAATST